MATAEDVCKGELRTVEVTPQPGKDRIQRPARRARTGEWAVRAEFVGAPTPTLVRKLVDEGTPPLLAVHRLLVVEVAALLSIERKPVPLLELGIRDFLRFCHQSKQYGRFGQRQPLLGHDDIMAKPPVVGKWLRPYIVMRSLRLDRRVARVGDGGLPWLVPLAMRSLEMPVGANRVRCNSSLPRAIATDIKSLCNRMAGQSRHRGSSCRSVGS